MHLFGELTFYSRDFKTRDGDFVCQNNTSLVITHYIQFPQIKRPIFYCLGKLYAHAIETINIQLGL